MYSLLSKRHGSVGLGSWTVIKSVLSLIPSDVCTNFSAYTLTHSPVPEVEL